MCTHGRSRTHKETPREHCGRGAKLRVGQGKTSCGGERTTVSTVIRTHAGFKAPPTLIPSGHSTARIEAEPAEPQQRRTEKDEGDVVRDNGLSLAAEPEGQDKGSHARRGVNDHAACEVDGAVLEQPPVVVEDPVRERAVDEQVPQGREHHEVDVPEGAGRHIRGVHVLHSNGGGGASHLILPTTDPEISAHVTMANMSCGELHVKIYNVRPALP